MKTKKFPDEQVVAALKRVQNGEHPSDISKNTNIDHATILNWCKKVGLQYKRKSSVYYRDWDMIKRAVGI